MPTKSKAKKQLPAAQSRKAENTAAKIILHKEFVAASIRTKGSVTQADTIIEAPNRCFSINLLDVGGHATTASEGKSVFRLSRFICPPPPPEFFHVPVNIVATPFSDAPCFLTVRETIVNHGTDLEITVFAWDAKGKPVADVSFYWRCLVALSRKRP
jgi:hypothetical protein